ARARRTRGSARAPPGPRRPRPRPGATRPPASPRTAGAGTGAEAAARGPTLSQRSGLPVVQRERRALRVAADDDVIAARHLHRPVHDLPAERLHLRGALADVV